MNPKLVQLAPRSSARSADEQVIIWFSYILRYRKIYRSNSHL